MAVDLGLALAGRGFFPETVPPCFTSLGLANFLGANRPTVDGERLKKRFASKLIRFSCTKTNWARRAFSTPTTANYLYICQFLTQHQALIDKHYKSKTTTSASLPSVEDVPSPRAIKIASFNELNLLVHKSIGRASFMLKTDIAQFYPSIYTHSIPWAIHTKAVCKGDRERDSKVCFFNELDYHLRNCQDGQTRGLFVGPDAARLISEILLADIDKSIYDKVGKHIVGSVRYVDDFFVGTETESDASLVFSAITEALDAYELIPNDVKTSISPTSKPTDDLWPLQLIRSARECFEVDEISRAHVKELFDTALTASSHEHTQGPIKLLLNQLDKYDIQGSDEYEFVEPYLMRFIHHFPHAIDYVCMIVGARVLRGKNIASADWTIAIANEIGRFIKLGQHQEVAWLLWLAIIAQLKLSNDLLDAILSRENGHLSAMIISAVRSGALKNKIAPVLPSDSDMRSDDWLTSHEALLAGLTKSKLLNDELGLHAKLLNDGYSFVDFGLAKKQLVSGAPVINSIKFGYEADEEFPIKSASVFQVSSQDF